MMDQLFLFPDVAPLSAATEAMPAAARPTVVEDPDPAQQGLFDARLAQLRAIRLAIAAGRLDDAGGQLASVEPGPDLDVAGAAGRPVYRSR
jgi:hypothetical protein